MILNILQSIERFLNDLTVRPGGEKSSPAAGTAVSGRNLRLDNAKGVLIFLVVLGHFLLPVCVSRPVNNLFYAIYAFHMPCFVMISGHLAAGLMKGGRFRYERAAWILLLYLIYELIVWITEGLAAGQITPWPDFIHESGAPWYLLCLFFWYLSVPAVSRLRGSGYELFAVLACPAAAIILKYLFDPGAFLALDRLISFAPFFYLGYFWSGESLDAFLEERGKTFAAAAVIAELFILFAAFDLLMPYSLVVYGVDFNRYMSVPQHWLWLLNLIWYALAAVISLGFLALMPDRPLPVVTQLGRKTLQIYLLHRPVRDLMEFAGFYRHVDPFSLKWLLFLCVFSLLLTLFLSLPVFGRPLNRLKQLLEKALRAS